MSRHDDLKELLSPPKSKLSQQKITLYLSERQMELLDHYSNISERGKSEFVRDALDIIFAQLREVEKEEEKSRAITKKD